MSDVKEKHICPNCCSDNWVRAGKGEGAGVEATVTAPKKCNDCKKAFRDFRYGVPKRAAKRGQGDEVVEVERLVDACPFCNSTRTVRYQKKATHKGKGYRKCIHCEKKFKSNIEQ